MLREQAGLSQEAVATDWVGFGRRQEPDGRRPLLANLAFLAVERRIKGLSVLTRDTLGLQSLIVSEGNVGPNKRVIIPKIYPQSESDAWQ